MERDEASKPKSNTGPRNRRAVDELELKIGFLIVTGESGCKRCPGGQQGLRELLPVPLSKERAMWVLAAAELAVCATRAAQNERSCANGRAERSSREPSGGNLHAPQMAVMTALRHLRAPREGQRTPPSAASCKGCGRSRWDPGVFVPVAALVVLV